MLLKILCALVFCSLRQVFILRLEGLGIPGAPLAFDLEKALLLPQQKCEKEAAPQQPAVPI